MGVKGFYNESMNREIALAFEPKRFDTGAFPFEEIPNQSKLFIDFQNNAELVGNFYPTKNTDLKTLSQKILENYKVDRQALCATLRDEHDELDASEETFLNIDRLREDDCVAVIAGQQAGLFSGAMYTIYKALSAIKLARDLNSQGIKAVPLFWIASEDHDFDEANKTFVLDPDGKLETITNEPKQVKENTPVSYIKLGKNIGSTIDHFFRQLPTTDFSDETRVLVEQIYQEDETYSSAFAKLILRLFGEYGLILVCPMNRNLRRLSSPIFVEAIEKHEEINSRLHERDKELSAKGYHSQVLVGDDFFPFFHLDSDRKRNALRYDSNDNLVRSLHSDVSFEKEDLVRIAKETPEQLSPNVLMRSVVQDYLFPTICYFGGSAEIAYFAQNEVIYKTLNRPVTQFRHRSSFTIVDPKSSRTLTKYDLKFDDMFRAEEELLSGIIDKYVAGSTAKTFDQVVETINEQLNNLEKELVSSEPTLADNLANRRKKILWHVETLKLKFHRAEVFKNEVLHNRIDYTLGTLYPRNALQERTLNVINFLSLFGPNFLDWIYDSIDLDEKRHQILYL